MNIKDYVIKEKDYITSLRRYFHKHPEESLKEYNTAKKIEEELDKLNIPHKRVGATGVLGIIKGKNESNRILAIRADIDALKVPDSKDVEYKSQSNGYNHACGHDGHTASLLGTAKILKEKEKELNGEVRLIFQQAEEVGQGAKVFIKEGYLDGVEEILGAHVASHLEVGKVSVTSGPISASCDYFKITVKGKGGHVSAPHLSTDALYIASQIVVNLQSIVSRQTDPVDTVVVGVGLIRGGTTYNTVAEEIVLEGTTRSFTFESREKTNKSVEKIAKSIGEIYGAEVIVEFRDYASPLINDEKVSEEVAVIASDIVGKENVITNSPKRLGADDFAEFLIEVPGSYIHVGTKNLKNANTSVAHHNDLFDIDEEGLLIITNIEVDYILNKLL
ncbi:MULTISPECIES: amidohydrolase [Clostridium]|uniref:Amidohydrolase n=1 Tax=Clostridium sartagoforme AAU1 TaxID=1202534 RepID=R9CFY0_9CLOT|nr:MULTISPECIES: amidohydrolase [Clostridium]EOR28193.1 amidohydrolase [Clostridium sartagoforme AAU1]KLE15528.1 peptidase M20 [Clostridium sp. C8]